MRTLWVVTVLLGSWVPGLGASGAAAVLDWPCGPGLVISFPSASSGLVPYSVASLPAGDAAPADGCFSRWGPLDVPALSAPAQRAPSQREERVSGWMAALLQTRGVSAPRPGFPLRLGNVASLEAEREVVTSLLEKVINNLIPTSDGAQPAPEELNFTLSLDHLRLNPQTLLGGRGEFNVDEDLNLLLESLTITVSSGAITSQTQLDPQSLSIAREQFQISLDIGNATVSSITTFEKNQGVTKQVLTMTAWLGQLQLHSQVTLALDSSEFRLGASISDLAITTISTIGEAGQSSQTIELEFNF